jgi:hypothetical protein
MATSYVTPQILLNQPAGLAWDVVPALTADAVTRHAQLAITCQTATSLVDGYLGQPLRAVAVTEQIPGPGMPRVAVDRNTGIATLITRQWPVIAVNAVQVSQARAFPPQWTPVPANQCRIRTPVLRPASGNPVYGPSGGSAVDIAPRYINRDYGRGGLLVSLSATSGYPHAGVTGQVDAGAESVPVDDVTGWDGWAGFILDGPATECASVTAAAATAPVQLPGAGGTVQAGPGTLTLASPLEFAHGPGAVFTAIPLAALHAAALTAAVMALEAITAIAAQSSSGMLPGGLGSLATESEMALDPFKRIM